MKLFIRLLIITLCFPVGLLAKNYYVSAGGNDTNDGSIENPWKTLAKVSVAAATDKNGGFIQPGDSILFRAGDIFQGQLVFYRSGNEMNPIVVSRYGAGEKPILSGSGNVEGGDYIETIKLVNSSYLIFDGLWVKNNRQNKGAITWGTNSSQAFKVIANKWGGISQGLTFRNLKITDVFGVDMLDWEGNFTRNYYSAHGIFFDSEKNDLSVDPLIEVGIEDVLIENCHFYNIGTTAISSRHLTNIRNNPVDDEDRNKNFVIRNNTFQQLGGDAIVLSGLYNGLVEKNDFIDLGWGDHESFTDRYFGRGEGCWTWNARNVIVQYNRQYRARGYGDCYGCGHVDFFCHNVIFQYNYSEETEGGFCEVLGDCNNTTYRFNVSVNDGYRENGHHRYSIWLSGYVGKDETPIPSDNNYIYNNTIYLDAAKCKPDISIFAKNTNIYNNLFYATGGAQIGAGGVEINMQDGGELNLSNNLFYGDIANDFSTIDQSKVNGQEPLFENPGSTEGSLAGFNIQPGSPALDKGTSFSEPEFPMAGKGIFKDIMPYASTDAFGNAVDLKNHVPNIGASNAHNSHQDVGLNSLKQVNDIFSIHSNPVREKLNLKMKHISDNQDIRIYSIQGEFFDANVIASGSLELQVQLPGSAKNGIYLIQVIQNNYTQTERFVLYR